MIFMRFEKRNNWGSIEYKFGENDWRGARVGFEGDGKFGPMFVPEATVRWPDGTTERCKVLVVSHTSHVSDMGHAYTVGTKLAYVVAGHHGHEIAIPIEEVEVAL